MAADGTWTLTMETPMGERKASVSVTTSGTVLKGTQSAEGENGEIYEGSANANDLAWKVDITNPLPMTLEFTASVSGDTMSGQMKAGMYGSWPFTGKRA